MTIQEDLEDEVELLRAQNKEFEDYIFKLTGKLQKIEQLVSHRKVVVGTLDEFRNEIEAIL